MRELLVFSDLHANKRALKEIAPVIKDVDLSIFCGDILGYGNDIDYCIDFILDNVDLIVFGNHDRLAITEESLENQYPIVQNSITFTRKNLSAEQRARMSSLPQEIWYDDIYVTHTIGDEYLRSNDDLKKLYLRGHKETRFFFFGHTHEQVLCEFNNRFFVNPGSIAKGRKGFSRSYVTIRPEDDIKFHRMGDIY